MHTTETIELGLRDEDGTMTVAAPDWTPESLRRYWPDVVVYRRKVIKITEEWLPVEG